METWRDDQRKAPRDIAPSFSLIRVTPFSVNQTFRACLLSTVLTTKCIRVITVKPSELASLLSNDASTEPVGVERNSTSKRVCLPSWLSGERERVGRAGCSTEREQDATLISSTIRKLVCVGRFI